jgi:hypothetical protein
MAERGQIGYSTIPAFSSIVLLLKSRGLQWAEHVAIMMEIRIAKELWHGNLLGNNKFKN